MLKNAFAWSTSSGSGILPGTIEKEVPLHCTKHSDNFIKSRSMIINQSHTNYIAHVRTSDKCKQTVATHLLEVADITKKLAAKINVPEAGELIGLLHDFGKYRASFQNYLQSGTGLI